MALKTDDCDIRDVRFYMDLGGNGDYYINLIEYPSALRKKLGENTKAINYRMAMSGGAASRFLEVKLAMANLYRAMQAAGLNNHPKDDELKQS